MDKYLKCIGLVKMMFYKNIYFYKIRALFISPPSDNSVIRIVLMNFDFHQRSGRQTLYNFKIVKNRILLLSFLRS